MSDPVPTSALISGGQSIPMRSASGVGPHVDSTAAQVRSFLDLLTSVQIAAAYQPIGSYAAESHGHIIGDVTGLQTALDGKQVAGSYAAASHTHGNITNAGAIGSTASLPVITGASGVLTVGAFGTTAGTFAQGDDSRITGAVSGTTGTTANRLVTATAADKVVQTSPVTADASGNLAGVGTVACGAITSGVAGTSNGQLIIGAAASVNAFITLGGTANLTLSARNNGLGVTWQLVTDTTGSGGPAAFRMGSTGAIGFGNTAANVGTIDVTMRRAAANTMGFYTTETGGTFAGISCGAITSSATMLPGTYTVGTLPSAAANSGAICQVTDSSVTNIGLPVAGGGSSRVSLFSNGTSWVVTSGTSAGGSVAATAVTVTVPVDSLDYSVTVSDASATATSKVIVNLGNHTDEDENHNDFTDLDYVSAVAGAGTITFHLRFYQSSQGPLNLVYLLG